MAGKGKAEGCAKCAKICLIVFNIIFCLIGVGLIAAGVYAYIQLSDYLDIVGNKMINAPAIVIIAFGCITFIIAAIGCIGAFKESHCLLFTFAVIIGILLVAEIAAGGAAFYFRKNISNFIDDKGLELMALYNDEAKGAVIKESWDNVQEKLECCGLNSSLDWAEAGVIPPPASCGLNTEGCIAQIKKIVEDNIYIVGAIGIAFGVIQLLGIVLACCVGCQSRDKSA